MKVTAKVKSASERQRNEPSFVCHHSDGRGPTIQHEAQCCPPPHFCGDPVAPFGLDVGLAILRPFFELLDCVWREEIAAPCDVGHC